MTGVFWQQLPGITLSNDDLTATSLNHNYAAVATIGRSSGKWYWEVVLSDNLAMIGVTSVTTGVKVWNTVNHRGYFSDGKKWSGASGVAYANTFIIGDTISILMDLDNGTLEFWKNGVSQGVAFNDLKSLGMIYPTHGSGAASTASTVTANFGKKTFRYKMPSGYERYQGYENKILLSSGDKAYSLMKKFSDNLIAIMTSNTTPAGKASASSIYSNNYGAWKAFDRLDDQFLWASTSKIGWLAYEFFKPVVIAKYTLLANSAELTQAPKNWKFEGSNDGVNWTVLDAQTNQVGWQSGMKREFVIINKKSFIQYRVNVTDNNGSSLLSIRGFEMYNYEINPDKLAIISNQSEQTFIRYGMDLLVDIDLFNGVLSVETKDNVLSSGKTYEHTIDMSKRRVDKITLS
ncbi:SPRY domain-containing protein [Paenibacillus sp. FSL H8-0104]|uniref:SPRY domain-containing protein n=1 Tax=Paenibacillus sp. FSL H8-0104 TaxID=2954509 RepID=UPI0030FD42F1